MTYDQRSGMVVSVAVAAAAAASRASKLQAQMFGAHNGLLAVSREGGGYGAGEGAVWECGRSCCCRRSFDNTRPWM